MANHGAIFGPIQGINPKTQCLGDPLAALPFRDENVHKKEQMKAPKVPHKSHLFYRKFFDRIFNATYRVCCLTHSMLEIQRWRGKSRDQLLDEGFSDEEVRAIQNRENRRFRPAFVNGERQSDRQADRVSPSPSGTSGFRDRFMRFQSSGY